MRCLVGIALLATACGSSDAFECREDLACSSDGVAGRCEATGFCSFPDDTCETGRRYGAHAGTLAHVCVESQGESSSTAATGDTVGGTAEGEASTGTAEGEASADADATASGTSSSISTSTTDGTDIETGGDGTTTGTATSSTDGEGSSGEASSTGTELPTCAEIYGDLESFVLCEEGPDTCEFQAVTNDQSCSTVCEARGGSCLDGWDNATRDCSISDADPGGCENAYFEQICECTRQP